MRLTTQFLAAAMQVLKGDDSVEAARRLEAAVIDDYAGDERLDELLYLLSMYSPGLGAPYCDAAELRKAVGQTLTDLRNSAESE